MSEFPDQHTQPPSPERQVLVLGTELLPLVDRLGHDDFSADITVYDRYDMFAYGSERSVAERELITNYFDYLSTVSAAASDDHTPKGQTIQELTKRFANETVYLSVADREQAVKGLADRQVEYLDARPGSRVAYFVRQHSADKSQGLLTGETLSYLHQNRPDLADRIQVLGVNPDADRGIIQALDAANTKVVLLDDWSVSGGQLKESLAAMRGLVSRYDRLDLLDTTEVNLLIARADQVQDGFSQVTVYEEDNAIDRPAPVVGYFSTPALTSPYEGPTPTGAHSTVDYGFDSRILEMQRYLDDRDYKADTLLPQIASIKKLS
ncbi:hypothetical protein H7097_02655 [Aeromicrobium sp.]|nr:hypothetical protein [Candidatus Saccharibacteria bacterium]